MGRITMELLRKRSEHNEGEIQTLEELALHQEKLEKIELIDKVCRNLKILLLQNNGISKIENVSRLKCLEYLNLALNTVEKIENLEGCESLKKLDLTLNFIAELTSIKSLKLLPHLQQLYLVGNPCHDFSGYRDYVVGTLPQLKSLDGRDITKSERIKSMQMLNELESLIVKQQEKCLQAQEEKKTKGEDSGFNSETCKCNLGPGPRNEDEEDEDGDFWQRTSGNTPEIRKEMNRRLERQEERKKPKDTKKARPPRKLTNADGKPLNVNEAKVSFSLHDEFERSQLVLDVAIPKHMCTSLIDADVQPSHVKITMKGKVFQLVLPEEVKPDSSFAQRSQVTGHLLITMPKVYDTATFVWQGKDSQHSMIDLTNTANNTTNVGPGGEANNNKGNNKTTVLTKKLQNLAMYKPKSKSKTSPRGNAPPSSAIPLLAAISNSPSGSKKLGQIQKRNIGGKMKVGTIPASGYDMPPPLF